jgi:hypothetical protein
MSAINKRRKLDVGCARHDLHLRVRYSLYSYEYFFEVGKEMMRKQRDIQRMDVSEASEGSGT